WIRPEGETGGKKKASADQQMDSNSSCLVYWLKPEEWASTVEQWVEAKAISGTICTFYEITEDDRSDATLKGLDERILLKALRILEEKGKATVMQLDNSYGVKFA